MTMNNYPYTRSFSDENDENSEKNTQDPSGPEYSFEGYVIDFSTKITLTPAAPPTDKK